MADSIFLDANIPMYAHVVSADKGFDAVAAVQRLDPMHLANWRHLVETGGSI